MTSNRKAEVINPIIPNYSPIEETLNYISHFVGFVFGIFSFIYFINTNNITPFKLISLLFYSVSMIALYFISFLYHFLPRSSLYKIILRRFDHDMIYFLILGTYFPVVALTFSNTSFIIVMSIEALCLIIGIILDSIGLDNIFTKIMTTIIYVVMGWVIICFKDTYTSIPSSSFIYILIGGTLFTVGVIFYVLGKRIKYFHSVFHLFTLLGTISQFIGIASLL